MNEPGGGIVVKWKLNYQPTILVVFSIILFGFVNTAVSQKHGLKLVDTIRSIGNNSQEGCRLSNLQHMVDANN